MLTNDMLAQRHLLEVQSKRVRMRKIGSGLQNQSGGQPKRGLRRSAIGSDRWRRHSSERHPVLRPLKHKYPLLRSEQETLRCRQPKRKIRSSASRRRFALKSWTKDAAIPEGQLRQLDLHLMLGAASRLAPDARANFAARRTFVASRPLDQKAP